MSSYNAPGVYIHDTVSGSQNLSLSGSSVGILFGVTRSGVENTPVKIGSWTEFISKFANGLDTPFLENSYLPYAVHGFFTNGGKELYIVNIKKSSVKATLTSDENNLKVTASSGGTWGNSISVAIAKSAGWTSTNKIFDVTISIGSSDSVTISEVTVSTLCSQVLANSKAKLWLSECEYASTPTDLTEETFTLATGSEGTSLTDSDYSDALACMDVLDDVTLVAIPGQTSSTVNTALLNYCDEHGLFPIIDMPVSSTAEQTKTYRKGISAFTGALAHPWGKMNDPLTNTLKAVPTCGHLMGLYARIIESRGVHKAPAGTEATVRGFVEMEYKITPSELSTLNSVGVICIMSRPNAGIVAWGARSLNSTDDTLKYVTDGLLNLSIKRTLYNGTQFAVFEPNDANLRSRVQATCKAFLETLRTSGALKGSSDEAYYVTVDDTNNTSSTIANGELNIEIGYAPVKPAEFVIIKLAHSIQS